jgi:hypothetical protein
MAQAIEIRMSLSPDEALVASWHDGDDPAEVINANKLMALTMNHHTEHHAVDWLYWRPRERAASWSPIARPAHHWTAGERLQAMAACRHAF